VWTPELPPIDTEPAKFSGNTSAHSFIVTYAASWAAWLGLSKFACPCVFMFLNAWTIFTYDFPAYAWMRTIQRRKSAPPEADL
jgi:hypothetical protein